MSAVQKNIFSAARSNNFVYLRECLLTCPKSDFEARDLRGNTSLWQAVSNMHIDAINVLVYEVGVDPDMKCELGNTVLHKALMMESVLPSDKKHKIDKILEVLTEKCNIRKINDEGKTPVFYASIEKRKTYMWLTEVTVVVDYNTIAKNLFKTSKSFDLVKNY